jgi:hypothetical protein
VQQVEHVLDGGFGATRVAGLDGELHHRTGRPSHRVRLVGELVGTDTAATLETLQKAAADGTELTFAADITTALELRQVVITWFHAAAVAGAPNRYRYEIHLSESPPLPPPAELDPFGGLGDFGVGDLGFDTDLLGGLEDLAGQVAGAVDAAMDAVDAVQALAALADLNVPDASGLLGPLQQPIDQVTSAGSALSDAASALVATFQGGPA